MLPTKHAGCKRVKVQQGKYPTYIQMLLVETSYADIGFLCISCRAFIRGVPSATRLEVIQ